MKSVIILLSSLLLGGFVSNSAEVINLATCNWQPYSGESLYNYGFGNEIVLNAFERAGYECKLSIVPWKRAMAGAESGKYDAVCSAYHNKERSQSFFFSDPYFESQLMLCSKKGSDIEYTALEDLKPFRIGIVRGYANSEAFDAADFLNKEEVSYDVQNVQKLLSDRIDLIVIDKYVAMYHVKTNPIIQATIEDLRFLTPPLGNLQIYTIFPKDNPKSKERVEAFNRALKEITEDGTRAEILYRTGYVESGESDF